MGKGHLRRDALSLKTGDLNMQVDCFCQLLKEQYANIWGTLANAGSVRQASDAVLLKFERPADQSEGVQFYRAGLGERWFTICSGTEPEVTIKADTAKTCDPALIWTTSAVPPRLLTQTGFRFMPWPTICSGDLSYPKSCEKTGSTPFV